MFVNGKDMLYKAKQEGKAIFQFNINNLEWTKAILEECDRLKAPVILGASCSAVSYMGGYNVVVSLVRSLILDLNIQIDVCLHLDHAKSFESCKKAIDAGFSSVMIDLSTKSFEENIKVTKEVLEYAKSRDVLVEAELGVMGSFSSQVITSSSKTNVIDCIKFIEETNVDTLAASVGSIHGPYKGDLNIDYKLIENIALNTSIPLVLHGGSGLSNEVLKKCVKAGITKININSDLQEVWSKSVRDFIRENKEMIDPRKIIESGIDSLKQEINYKMNINK